MELRADLITDRGAACGDLTFTGKVADFLASREPIRPIRSQYA